MIDGWSITYKHKVLHFHIIEQIHAVIFIREYGSSICYHLSQVRQRLIRLELYKVVGCEKYVSYTNWKTYRMNLTFMMAYSMRPPLRETKCLFFSTMSSTSLIGNVNCDKVRKAVKLAV